MRLSAGLASLVLLGGCANGDFGRLKPSLVTDDMHAWVAADAPAREGKAPSQLPLTDAERQLRDLAYPLIEPPYDRQRWYSVLAEYHLAGEFRHTFPERSAYATRLMTTAVRSQNARYSRLIDDIRNDAERVDPFFAVARYVVTMDQKRAETLARFGAANREARGDARARIAENAAVIDWVKRSLRERAASYQLALEQLAVVAPSPMASEAARSMTLLQMRIDANREALRPAVATNSSAPSLDPNFRNP